MTNIRRMMMGAGAVAGEVTTEGSLYSSGAGRYGMLGHGNTTDQTTHTRIGTTTTWEEIACDEYATAAILENGTLWTWGKNSHGGLAHGNKTDVSAPDQVGSLTNWKEMVGSQENGFMGLKTDGTLWGWGWNQYGALGDSTVISRSSPVQIGSLTTWASIGGYTGHAGVKTDGTMWTWGYGSAQYGSGEHGQGHVLAISSPTQLGSATNWARVPSGGGGPSNHMVAVKTDGTLWGWGQNHAGRAIPNSTQTAQSSPVQIGSLTNWAHAREKSSCGNAHHIHVKTDGTLWGWGKNTFGNLGDGSVTDRDSPIQIGSKTDWVEVGCGVNSSFAINDNGELYAWGRNTSSGPNTGGLLGDGTTTSKSSPVQIGTVITWGQIAAGAYHSVGFHTA